MTTFNVMQIVTRPGNDFGAQMAPLQVVLILKWLDQNTADVSLKRAVPH